jgi:hypothetical protein
MILSNGLSQKSNIDKVIGSEGQRLAEKRLAAIKRAREMSSESENAEVEKSSSTSFSFSNGPASFEVSGSDYWEQLGPSYTPNGQTYSDRGTRVNVTGRVTAIVPHPIDRNSVYIGAAQGVVWKTTDRGKKWIVTSDYALSLAIGAPIRLCDITNATSTKDIELAVEKGKKYSPDVINKYSRKSLGIDPGFGSSPFGLVVTEWVDNQIQIAYAEEFGRPNFNQMIKITLSLVSKYGITFDNGCRVLVDGANPSFIRSLKYQLGENADYRQEIDY